MLSEAVDYLLYSLIGLDPQARIAQSVHFFVYDSIKILLLLFFMITIIGFFRTFIPAGKVKAWLTGRKKGFGHAIASIFGAATPFCSCSSIPLFISYMQAGIPLGIAFSFLITSPIVNEYLVVIMLSEFGWKITGLYVLSGIIVGIVFGWILGNMGLEKYLEKDILSKRQNNEKEKTHGSIKERISYGISEATSITKKIWYWILIGVGLGAVIHNFVPAELIQSLIAKGGVFTVPIATILGVPMYANCAAIVPVAVVLFNKGLPLGTALAFMMATSALSLPEAVILRRAMKLKLIAIFFGIVAAAIVLTGYVFNLLSRFL